MGNPGGKVVNFSGRVGFVKRISFSVVLKCAATEKNAKALAHTKKHLEYKKDRVLEAAKQLGLAVRAVYAHLQLDQDIVSALNPGVQLSDLAEDIAEIGYPER